MKVENHTIDFIPESERHGKPRKMFNVLFGLQATFMSVISGAFAIEMGLNVAWSIMAIVLGHCVGGIFLASHSAQGPHLGIPQMIQSRAQFGFKGAMIPIFFVIFEFICFFTSNGIIGAQSLYAISPAISVSWWIIILSFITLVINIFGHDMIHSLQKYLTIIICLIFFFASFKVFSLAVPAGSWSLAHFQFKPFLYIFCMCTAWELISAPYVADYSRYLPSNTSSARIFWFTYAGSVISSVWLMILGVLLAAAIPGFLTNPSVYFTNLFDPGFQTVILITIGLGIIATNVLNLYAAFLSTTTIIVSIKNYQKLPSQIRLWILILVTVFCTTFGIWGQNIIVSYLSDVLVGIGYLILPWSAINLVDFYFLRKGKYSVKDIFDSNGIYGKFNWIAMSAFVVAIIAEIPFMNLTFFKGAVAEYMGGADLSWLIGSIIPGFLYYYFMKRKFSFELNNLKVEMDSQV